MSPEWIIRVAGKEYGPADLATLREWREDGRVLPGNEARRADSEVWLKAEDIADLFPPPPVVARPPVQKPGRTFWQICGQTIRIYFRGFIQYLGLSLLVIVPSICTQLTGAFLEGSQNVDVDARTLLAGGFGLCMFLLTLTAWPIYLSGIQILTAELSAGRRIGFFPLLNEAVKYWPRVALLCVFVYFSYFFWTAFPVGVIFAIALGGPSFISFFLALALAVFQVWIVGRLFINYMFWQQTSVLGGCGVADALRVSRQIARSGRGELPWYQRPFWRGTFVFSLWTVFILALNFQTLYPQLAEYWQQVTTATDPQALMQAMAKARPETHVFDATTFAMSALQAFLRPLLGIAFVLIYFDARARMGEDEERARE